MKTLFAILFPIVLLAACRHGTPAYPADSQPIPRSVSGQCGRQMCTMQYEPVCATIQENGRTREQTFGNSCMVCGGAIVSVRKGACGGVSLARGRRFL